MSTTLPISPRTFRQAAMHVPSVNYLRDLLGHDVLLLHWPLGTKGIRKKWGHLTVNAMANAHYLAKLETGNIGVALGEKSNGVCAIDLDIEELVEPFIAANPRLSGTLQTHGARGRVFWLRIVGDFPASANLKRDEKKCGEWRANGNQSIVAGVHPDTRQPYQIVCEANPIEIAFSEINWPNGVSFKAKAPSPPETKTLETTSNAQLLCTSEPLLINAQYSVKSGKMTEGDIVTRCLPKEARENHMRLFDLARGVRALERERGSEYGDKDLERIFSHWYRQAATFIRAGQTKEQYFEEFLGACDCAERPLDENALLVAWQKAKSEPLPVPANSFKSKAGKMVVALCWQLQVIAGDREFYLSCHKAAPLLEVSPQQTAGLLRQAVRKQILRVVETWRMNRATRYKFVGYAKTSTLIL